MSDAADATVYVFPDTNVFLHFRYEDIDWPVIVGARQVVLVVGVKSVVHELDRHKINKSERIKKRAGAALRRIEELESKEVRAGVSLATFLPYPRPAEGLDVNHIDERLIASAMQWRDEKRAAVAIATDDTGMRLTARAHGVRLVELPEAHRLPDEPDEAVAELQRVKLELQKLRTQRARLGLRFNGNVTDLAVRFAPLKGWLSDEQIEFKLDLYRETAHMRAFVVDVDAHIKAQRKYLQAQRDFLVRQAVTFPVNLVLINDGNAPAENVDVTAEVPERVIVTTEEETAPVEPRAAAADLLRSAVVIPRIEFPRAFEAEESKSWSDLGSNRWRHHKRRLMHAEERQLPPLFLRPHDKYDRKGFQIKVCVRAATPPILEDVELNVRFEQ